MKGRPYRAAFASDAWPSCAGSGELAPEVGILMQLRAIDKLQNGPDLRGSLRTGTALGRGRSAAPNRPPNTIVAKVYGGGAQFLEPNWFSSPCLSALLGKLAPLAPKLAPNSPRPNLSLTNFGNTIAALSGYTCGKAVSYVGFSETSAIIVRVRSCGLAVSRRRRRAYSGCRSSPRSLERKYR